MTEDLPNDRLMRLEKDLAFFKAEAERLRAELQEFQEQIRQAEQTGDGIPSVTKISGCSLSRLPAFQIHQSVRFPPLSFG
jgi:prefoldin subunit 5